MTDLSQFFHDLVNMEQMTQYQRFPRMGLVTNLSLVLTDLSHFLSKDRRSVVKYHATYSLVEKMVSCSTIVSAGYKYIKNICQTYKENESGKRLVAGGTR